jgi:hypothetical protein
MVHAGVPLEPPSSHLPRLIFPLLLLTRVCHHRCCVDVVLTLSLTTMVATCDLLSEKLKLESCISHQELQFSYNDYLYAVQYKKDMNL